MKKILILLLSLFSVAISAQQKKVAVYVTGEQSGITKVLGDQLVVAFAKSGKYAAVERTNSFLAELSKEQSYQRSGAVNDNDIARLGIQFGVNYVCVADMSDVFGEKYISARLIDVETAVIINAHNVSGAMANMDDCLKMAGEIASKLSDKTIAEQQKEELARQKEAARQAELARQREARRQELLSQGWVDLGLPSGTLWKDANEGARYTYDEAVSRFGNKLPTNQQLEELKNRCTWTWMGSEYKVTGPSGDFITLPAAGYRSYFDDDVVAAGWQGNYWSSTPYDSDDACYLYFYESKVYMDNKDRRYGLSVRLVQNL